MARYKVVIVGGGFGGVKTALALSKSSKVDLTLIYDHPDFRYYPTLYETATGTTKRVSSMPIKEVFSRLPVNLISGKLVDIDRPNHQVILANGEKYSYDALVLGLGVETNYFHIEGLQEFSFGIKTVEDAEKFKSHLHQQLTADNSPDHNYVIVGGGPTGVELAGALPGYIKKIVKNHNLSNTNIHVDLVEAAPRLLPRAPKDMSKRVTKHLKKLGIRVLLNTVVQSETADALMINNKPIRSHTVVWTAGVANSPFYSAHNFQLTKNGRVRVDQFLQAEPGIYVVGDNADTPYSGMAQTAIYDGSFIANNLLRIIDHKSPKPYFAKQPIYVYSAGPKWCAVLWGSLRFYGRSGALLKKLSELVGYHDYEPWKMAALRLADGRENEEYCPICASSLGN